MASGGSAEQTRYMDDDSELPPGGDETPPRRGTGCCIAAGALSLVWPGLGHRWARVPLRRSGLTSVVLNFAATVFLVVVLAPVSNRSELASVIADRLSFVAIGACLAVLGATRLHTTVTVAAATRPAPTDDRSWRTPLALGAVGVLAITTVVPLAVAADYVWETDRMLERVFHNDDDTTAIPGTVATTAPTATTGASPTGPSTTAAPTTTERPFVGLDRVNILLLGGDSGPGRWSMRTDSMIVVSIDPDSGDTAMVSVPRNLPAIEFPPGTALAERFPDGFDNIANAVWTYVNEHRELAGGGEDAGAQAIKLGIAQLLGIPIQYYVLVDMAGFVRIVDSVGGIDINVRKRVPVPGNPDDSMHAVPDYFEVGPQHMDGVLALAYARTRSADSDYGRMGRQRCVLAGIANAATPRALALGLTDLLDAFGDSVSTDIPRDVLPDLAQLVDRFAANGGMETVRALPLTPPTFDPKVWKTKRQYIRDVVTNTLVPGTLDIEMPFIPPLVNDECK